MPSDGTPSIRVAERIYALHDDGWLNADIAFFLDVSHVVVERTLDRRPEEKR